jgi:hypothetical protein
MDQAKLRILSYIIYLKSWEMNILVPVVYPFLILFSLSYYINVTFEEQIYISVLFMTFQCEYSFQIESIQQIKII